MRLSMNRSFWLSSSWLCIFMMITAINDAANTINIAQSMSDGENLVSSDGSFKLGFFEAGSTKRRYLGIWYNKLPVMTVVWVANRNQPLINSTGVLKVTPQGNLELLTHTESVIWSTNSSRTARNPVSQLQDSGNLVVKEDGENNDTNIFWQSFDYPSDTLMPGMKLGINKITGFHTCLSSWKSTDDPSEGNFVVRVDPEGYPELIVKEGSQETFRFGPWNGIHFSGMANLNQNSLFSYEFVYNENEIYYTFLLKNELRPTRLTINPNGKLQRFMWIESIRDWKVYHSLQNDDCDQYALCGPYGTCNNNAPLCSCMRGFEPKSPKGWDMGDWEGGCRRKTPLNCTKDGFQQYHDVKLPATHKAWFNNVTSLEECKNKCQNNCSCTAYANLDVRNGGSGCLLWFGDLIDIRQISQVLQDQDLYVRMSASDLEGENKIIKKKRMQKIVISVLVTGMVFFLALTVFIWKRKQLDRISSNKFQSEDLELAFFDFVTIATATDNFARENKLGEGGFGPVYKGALKDGQEIAVKRRSKHSQQGLDEFKNEVKHISRLQHRNLVKLLGCCIQRNEQMLVYELMPNKSLDIFIFDQAYSRLLDWSMRYNIINGIARGLLYLHQDSRLRIIHRDLKTENILLDYDMNPKISDFGMARSFGGHETEGNTKRVVGTLGYMSPEYVSDGLYSTKSDVFSFGVMVLEIISEKRNRRFCNPNHRFNLLGHAWILYRENRSLDLVSDTIKDSYNESEVLRVIHMSLLCVQSNPEDRPSMPAVVLMLSGEGALAQPKQPGFFTEIDEASSSSSSTQKPYSANEMSITLLEAR